VLFGFDGRRGSVEDLGCSTSLSVDRRDCWCDSKAGLRLSVRFAAVFQFLHLEESNRLVSGVREAFN
jgi:hypothetical protein